MIFDDLSASSPLARRGPPRLLCPDLDLAMTVNDVLRRVPQTGPVFNAFGVDACCGGARALADAARTAGLEPALLLDALTSVVCAPTAAQSPGAAGEGR